MDEYMTLEQMEREYDGEWVLFAEPKLGAMTELLGGVVVFHGPAQADVQTLLPRSESMASLASISSAIHG